MAFDVRKDYSLEDDVVLLRPLEYTDYNYLLPFALLEPELWKHSPVPADSEENLRRYIDNALDAREAGNEYPFIVFDKRFNAYAGSTRFCDIQIKHRCLQIGFTWYGKAFQGTGLNKHCKYLLLEFAFETMGMLRVEFRADNTNARSIAAMKRIGCKEEGVLRSHLLLPDGRRRDSLVLSILKEEWEREVKNNLIRMTNM